MQMLPVIPQAEIAPSIGKTGSGEVSGTGNFSPFLQVATEHEGKKVPSTEEELIVGPRHRCFVCPDAFGKQSRKFAPNGIFWRGGEEYGRTVRKFSARS